MQDIDKRLRAMGACIADYGKEAAHIAASAPVQPLPADEPILPAYHPSNVNLNEEQKAIARTVVQMLHSPAAHPRIVHIEAAAGSGKTFLCLVLAMYVRCCLHQSARCTAFTAKAASNYPGGHTAHYEFQLNVTSICEPSSTRLTFSSQSGHTGTVISPLSAHLLRCTTLCNMHAIQILATCRRQTHRRCEPPCSCFSYHYRRDLYDASSGT